MRDRICRVLGPVYLTVYFCDLGDKARRCRLNQDWVPIDGHKVFT